MVVDSPVIKLGVAVLKGVAEKVEIHYAEAFRLF